MSSNLLFDKLRSVEAKYEELNQLLADPDVVSDSKRYQKTAKTHSDLGEIVSKYREYKELERGISQTKAMLHEVDSEPEMKTMAEEELAGLEQRLEECEHVLKLLLLPKDPNDERNVILEIRAGTGGDEAGLFVADLFRMYSRYAERQGWRIEIMSSNATGVGGYKEIIALIEGKGVYSQLKYESGVHRVQRVPATEAQGRIHTSAVTVAVMPEAEEVEVAISEKDLRIDTFCSSGPGGQSVNTTYSAVRITHIPTGLVVSCQDEKSQIKNRAKGLRVLRSRLYELEMEKQQKALSDERRSMIGTGDRSEKIRTYNYRDNRVSDHRIGLTLHQLDRIMDGEVGEILDALASHYQAERLKKRTRGVTIRETLIDATQILESNQIPNSRLTAEILLGYFLSADREYLFAHAEEPVDAAKHEAFGHAVWKRSTGEPLQYITGVQEFYGRAFTVNRDVLIPRPETELIIDAVMELDPRAGNRIVDVGTGSGCIAVTLALEVEGARVFAGDVSEDALRVARLNSVALETQVRFVCMDLLDAVEGDFDFVVSNPPYVPEEQLAGLQREVRDHEPWLALVGRQPPMETYRRLILAAHERLRPGGHLVMEIGLGMEDGILGLLGAGWWKLPTKVDLQGIPRTVIAQRN